MGGEDFMMGFRRVDGLLVRLCTWIIYSLLCFLWFNGNVKILWLFFMEMLTFFVCLFLCIYIFVWLWKSPIFMGFPFFFMAYIFMIYIGEILLCAIRFGRCVFVYNIMSFRYNNIIMGRGCCTYNNMYKCVSVIP